jgi:hypothetical protein
MNNHLNRLLTNRFPNEPSVEEVTMFLQELLRDYTVEDRRYFLLSTDGADIELQFSLKIRLRDGRHITVDSTGWYNGGEPQTGVDLINNFSLHTKYDQLASDWLDMTET